MKLRLLSNQHTKYTEFLIRVQFKINLLLELQSKLTSKVKDGHLMKNLKKLLLTEQLVIVSLSPTRLSWW